MAPKKQKVKKSKKSKPAAVQDNADQLVKAGRLKPGEKPDRAILWKKARQTAEGMVVDTGLSDVLKKIKTRKDASKKKDKIEMRNVVAKFKKVEVANSVPNGFNSLYKHATTIMKETGDSIAIPCDVEVFGCDKVIYILHENLIALLKFEEIGQAAITAHMSYLHGMIRENNEMDVYGFIDPGATFNLNKEFETYVVKRLMNGSYDRMFLMPHNFKMPPRRDTSRNNAGGQQIVMDRETFLDMVREVANQQRQNPPGNVPNQEGQTMFDRFMKQRPNVFKEAKHPMDAEALIDHMEKIFRVLNCSEEEKARFGIYCLEGDASTWWKSVVASHAAGYEDTLTWNVFKAHFDQRYFPASVREEYAREYQNIAQKEDESVADFQIRFQRLANYARSIAGNDADKIMKFK
ncbi:hypothetical protein ACET3Z_010480 [Daucus carota]